MPLHVRNGGSWKQVRTLSVRNGGAWKTVRQAWICSNGTWRLFFQNAFNLTISSDQTSGYNLNNALVAAGWNGSTPVEVTVTINSGVQVRAPNTSTGAFVVGSLPAGSSVTIINRGYILGRGGDGGRAASKGKPGGPAIVTNYNISIDNTLGYIAGGGGGGGGGGDDDEGTDTYANGGGGAGGGAGSTSSVAGAGNGGWTCPGSGGSSVSVSTTRINTNFAAGKSGTAGGSGGASCGRRSSSGDGTNNTVSAKSGAGGSGGGVGGSGSGSLADNGFSKAHAGGGGGGWGAAGGIGRMYLKGKETTTYAGGAGGPAITTNGKAISWIGGYQPNRTFGAIV